MSDVGILQEQIDANTAVAGFSTSVDKFFASPEIKAGLVSYLQSEIDDTFEGTDRKSALDKWELIRRHRKALPENETKNWPWPNASNITTPVTMSNTLGMYAKVKAIFAGKRPLIALETDDEASKPAVQATEKFLNAYVESPLHLNFAQKADTLFYEVVSMGSQAVDVAWVKREQIGKRFDANGVPETYNVISFDGPDFDFVPLEDTLTRPYWDNVKAAPWIGFQKRFMGYSMVQLAKQQFFENVLSEDGSLVQASIAQELRPYERANLGQEGFSGNLEVRSGDHYDVQKVYVMWDVDGDGLAEDVIVWFHKETGTILRAEYNSIGIRPVVMVTYVKMPHELYGLGVGEMSIGPQTEIDSFHNIGNNALQLHSLQMLLTRTGSRLGGSSTWYPGKQLEVDDPQNDVKQLTFPDPSMSLTAREGLAREYLNRAIGASDPSMGYSDSILRTRATASGAAFQAQTQDGLFGNIVTGIVDAVSELFQLLWLQMVANPEKAKVLVSELVSDPAEQELINGLLDMDIQEVPRKMKFRIRTTPSSQTEEAKRQGLMVVNQLYTQFEDRMLQLMGAFSSPQVPPEMKAMIGKFLTGHAELISETFKLTGFRDTDEFVPWLKNVELMVEQIEQSMGKGAQGGVNGGQGSAGQGMVPGAGGPMAAAGGAEQPGFADAQAGGMVASGEAGGAQGSFNFGA